MRLFAPPALLIVMLHCWIIKMRSRALLPTSGGWEEVLFRSCSQVNSQQIFMVEWLAATCLLHYCNFRVMHTKLLHKATFYCFSSGIKWNPVSNDKLELEVTLHLDTSKLQHTLVSIVQEFRDKQRHELYRNSSPFFHCVYFCVFTAWVSRAASLPGYWLLYSTRHPATLFHGAFTPNAKWLQETQIPRPSIITGS